MFSLHGEPLFGGVLHETMSDVVFEAFISLPGRNMAKVFKIFKEPICQIWSVQKFWGEEKVEISNFFTSRYLRIGK